MALRYSLLVVVLAACGNDVSLGGPNTLVRVDPEPDGPNCAGGGVAINTGLDQDGDTYLDDEEITSTQYVCNGSTTVQCAGGNVLAGTITIRDPGDWKQLDGVNCVDGELLIAGTSAESIPDHKDLEIVTGDLVVVANGKLTSLDGIDHVRQIGGIYLVQGNDALTSVAALGNLQRTSAIQITGNDALPDLKGFEAFVDIGFSIQIANNSSLTSLDGLDGLHSIGRTLSVRANNNLTSISALAGLRQAQLLEFATNNNLADISLPSLDKIDVRLLVTGNSALGAVSLPALTTVGDFMRFDSDPQLVSVNLPALLTAGSLLMTNDNNLTTVAAPALVFTTASFNFVNVARLSSLQFDNLTSIGDALLVNGVPALLSFNGLPLLQSIGGDLTVTGAGGLLDFTGLAKLQSVSGTMSVTANTQIHSFAGLSKFTEVGGDLKITNNPMLPKPTSQAFANGITVRGTVTIN